MNKLTYRKNDLFFPNASSQTIEAEKFLDTDLSDATVGRNVLEGLCFDHEQNLYICVPVQGDILKVSIATREVSLFSHLPDQTMPSALKLHRNGRLSATIVNSDKGSLIAVLDKEGHHIDDMVFDHKGGFYCSDLSGTFDHPTAGIFYVHPDLKTVDDIIPTRLIKTNGIVLTPDEKSLFFTEFGAGKLDAISFGYDGFAQNPYKPLTVFYFTEMEGPDSMVIDCDSNLYVSMTGHASMSKPLGALPINSDFKKNGEGITFLIDFIF